MSMSWPKHIELNSDAYSRAVERSKSTLNALIPAWNVERFHPDKCRMTTILSAGNSNFKNRLWECLLGFLKCFYYRWEPPKCGHATINYYYSMLKCMKIPLTGLIDRFVRGCKSDYRKTFTNVYSSEYCWSAISDRDRLHSRSFLPVWTHWKRQDGFIGYDDM